MITIYHYNTSVILWLIRYYCHICISLFFCKIIHYLRFYLIFMLNLNNLTILFHSFYLICFLLDFFLFSSLYTHIASLTNLSLKIIPVFSYPFNHMGFNFPSIILAYYTSIHLMSRITIFDDVFTYWLSKNLWSHIIYKHSF